MIQRVTTPRRLCAGGFRLALVPTVLLAGLLLLLIASPARAALLAPGDVLSPVPLKADPVGGSVLDTLVTPIVSSSFTGTLTINVVDDPGNPLGGLTFTFGIENDPDSDHSIGRLTLNDFGGFTLSATFLAPGVTPALADRSDGDGDVVGFSFIRSPVGLGAIGAGSSSALLVIETNARDYTAASTAAVINGSAVVVPSLAPVPEPATAGLALVATSALLLRRGRRRGRDRVARS